MFEPSGEEVGTGVDEVSFSLVLVLDLDFGGRGLGIFGVFWRGFGVNLEALFWVDDEAFSVDGVL